MPRKKRKPKKQPEKPVQEDRTFRVVVFGLVCVIVLSVVVLFTLKYPPKEVKTFANILSQKLREQLNSGAATPVQSQEHKNASFAGKENESMVKKVAIVWKDVFVESGASFAQKDSKVVIEDVAFGPSHGFVEAGGKEGEVFHYLNASLVNYAASAKDCSMELSTINNNQTIKTKEYIGVLKPQQKVELSFVLSPIAGQSQLSLMPVCS